MWLTAWGKNVHAIITAASGHSLAYVHWMKKNRSTSPKNITVVDAPGWNTGKTTMKLKGSRHPNWAAPGALPAVDPGWQLILLSR